MPRKKNEKQPDFETSLAALETLVERMESGELTLEESLKEFERGMALTRECQKMLDEAEQRVRILTDDGRLEPFDEDGGTDDPEEDIPF